MMPQAGGLYVYLRAAYGPMLAFLFGWVEFLIVRSGSMATLAAAFARYFAQLCPPPFGIGPEVWQAGAAIFAIVVVTTVNVLGTRRGGTLQVAGTVLKVGGVAILMALPFVLRQGTLANMTPVWPGAVSGGTIFKGMMAAMVSVLWAYDGWTNVTPLAEEIRDPGRNVPRALIIGMGVLIAAYVGMTLAYHYVLPMQEVASASRDSGHIERAAAAVYCKGGTGQPGVVAISILVMCSTFISLNGNALTGPRAYFAMARDRLFPGSLSRVHTRFQTPANAILSQGIWSILLTIAGTVLILVPPPDSPAGLAGPIATAWKRLNRRRSTTCPPPHMIFAPNLFHAGDQQCIRASHSSSRAAAPLSHRGLSRHAAALRGRRLRAFRQHAPRPCQPCDLTRASESSSWAFRPTGSSGEPTAVAAGEAPRFVTTVVRRASNRGLQMIGATSLVSMGASARALLMAVASDRAVDAIIARTESGSQETRKRLVAMWLHPQMRTAFAFRSRLKE